MLFVADNFRAYCDIEQRQFIEEIKFNATEEGRRADLTMVVLQGRKRLPDRDRNLCGDGKAVPPPSLKPYRLDFVLGAKGYSIAPWSSVNAHLTSLESSNRFFRTAKWW
jgi:hypothetical protein